MTNLWCNVPNIFHLLICLYHSFQVIKKKKSEMSKTWKWPWNLLSDFKMTIRETHFALVNGFLNISITRFKVINDLWPRDHFLCNIMWRCVVKTTHLYEMPIYGKGQILSRVIKPLQSSNFFEHNITQFGSHF